MGGCLSREGDVRHPREKSMWQERERERKVSRPRGATIGGAHPLREAAQQRRSRGMTEDDLANTLHEEVEVEEDIRKSLSEDSLSKKVNVNRTLI